MVCGKLYIHLEKHNMKYQYDIIEAYIKFQTTKVFKKDIGEYLCNLYVKQKGRCDYVLNLLMTEDTMSRVKRYINS